jgi:hypothetical protein
VAKTVTCEVPSGAVAVPLKPHPANPAVKANAPAATKGNRVRRLRPPTKAAKLVSPPGHQKTMAIKVDPSGFGDVPAGAMLRASCGLSFMVSAKVADVLPPSVT